MERSATQLQDGRFLLLETLGHGGMGSVYRAFDRAEQRLVALKVPSEPTRPGPAHPLSAEFEAWSYLCHPNIVEAYEMGLAKSGPIAEDTPYLVLEHVAGGPAHHVLRPGRLAPTVAEAVAGQLLGALAHVHSSGFVHRDLKPANVLVDGSDTDRPRVRLTDFGLAVRAGMARDVGNFSGSLHYAAPETLLGMPLDGRVDLYGLGILLYQLTTGELPSPTGGPDQIVRWHLGSPGADPSRIRPMLSRRWSRFIYRLTARDPDRRPASASAALRLLGPKLAAEDARGSAPIAGRASRAGLRLALDAARLGAMRVFHLPSCALEAAGLLREVAVWAQIRGLRYYAARARAEPATVTLGRVVLRLLLDLGPDAARCVRRYRLARSLPLTLIGAMPILDPSRSPASAGRPPSLHAAVEGICEFLLRCAVERPMVLCLERPAREQALVRELHRELPRALQRRGGRCKPGRGGLLLLIGRRRAPSSAAVG